MSPSRMESDGIRILAAIIAIPLHYPVNAIAIGAIMRDVGPAVEYFENFSPFGQGAA